MLTIEACIEKSDITPIGKMKGALNSDKCSLNGETHEPESLVFRGFVGTMDLATRKFIGVFRFEPAQPADATDARMSVANLPKVTNTKTADSVHSSVEHREENE